MDDETILVIAMLGGIAVMIAVLLLLRGKAEARLTAQETIEIPIDSTARSVAVVLAAMFGAPMLVVAIGVALGPKDHALALTLGTIGSACVALPLSLRLTRAFRRIGTLRLTPSSLELEKAKGSQRVDLSRPFSLRESFAQGPYGNQIQTVFVEQDDARVGISYLLPAGRKPYGEFTGAVVDPQLSGEVRVLHDRLRGLGHAQATTTSANRPR